MYENEIYKSKIKYKNIVIDGYLNINTRELYVINSTLNDWNINIGTDTIFISNENMQNIIDRFDIQIININMPIQYNALN